MYPILASIAILFTFTFSNGFHRHSFLLVKNDIALPINSKTSRMLSDSGNVRDSIPEQGLRRIDVDTDDIVRESTDVIAPTDTPHSGKWGYHVKGPRSTSGHLVEKNENVWSNLERRHEKWDQKVEVHSIKDIDPVTITALLFAALAVNFFIFAHLGDTGLGNLVARFINNVS